MRGVSDLSILLATVNISRSKICQKIPKLMLVLAPPELSSSRLDTRGRCRPPNRELYWHGIARNFFRGGHQQINNICHFLITKMFTTK
jgi:hypothetical protein